jgi:predicted DCC family thiol-disulfide oxidoreductase YuxK
MIKMSKTRQIEIYTDGACPLCRWSRERVEPLDTGKRLQWLDFRTAEAQARAAPHTVEELNDEMHVRRADGTWVKGYAGWLEILAVIPQTRPIARILRLWPFRAVGPVFYRWLARRRFSLFGMPPPCDANGACSLHARKS